MSKARVFDLAKELGLSSKEMMAKLQELGFAIASHMATLEDKEVKLIMKKFGHLKREKKPEPKKAKPKKKKEAVKPEEKKPKKTKKKEEEPEKKKKEPAKAKEKKEPGKVEKKEEKPAEKKPARRGPHIVSPPPPAEAATLEPQKGEKKEERPAEKKPARRGPHIVSPPPPAEAATLEPQKGEKKEEGPAERKPARRRPARKGPHIVSPPPPPAAADTLKPPEAKRPGRETQKDEPRKKSRSAAARKAMPEDDSALLLEERQRIEWRTRRRDRKKTKRPRDRKRAKKPEQAKVIAPPPPSERLLRRKARGPRRPVIMVDEVVTVDELARQLKLKASTLILELMKLDVMATKNQPLELEIVKQIAEQHEHDIQVASSPEDLLEEVEQDAPEKLVPRAPVVTVMGHVDHGKTALLDAIRTTDVMAGEAGGITQHIGAYRVEVKGGHVVFLDTPGHEAFTAMRAHGAQVTDVVVLVVAADDGIMPQTLEAVNHAHAAKVPIVVAVNKMDLPSANLDRVKQQLAELELVPEDWGGKTITLPVSAKTKEGISSLLEMLLLEAEMLELKGNPDRAAQGIVLEAKLDRGRGPVATVLVQNGTLRVGDAFVSGAQFGRVRALLDDRGESITEAGPASPVEVLGFTGVPLASDPFIAVEDEKKARQVAVSRALKQRQKEMVQRKRITLEDLYDQIQEGEVSELGVIIKGDVQGSVVALQDALIKLPTDSVKLNVIHAGVGGINESDIILASASNALLIGFNVRPDAKARELAEKEGVDYKLYRIIYDLIDDVRAAMEGLLEPERKEIFLGRADVLQTFKVSSVGAVAGCRVAEGEIVGNQNVRLVRDGIIVFDGKISSLKRYKDFARSAPAGTECGIGLENFNDIKVDDVIECYRVEHIARKL